MLGYGECRNLVNELPRRSPTGLRPKAVSLNERKQALVRETIWEAAIDLFAQKGFDETTVDDIAIAAGTSRPSVFRYFKSKSDFIALPIISYGTFLIDAIQSCPINIFAGGEYFRHTLLAVAKNSAANPRAKKVMEIAAKYPEANQAQLARLAGGPGRSSRGPPETVHAE